ncbi:hypothetical protein [Microbacterium xanthum]|uniref:hypothetical protein n=1 Tax=Microbacterium xanthum TaxID=3079794 RepID=UPI002AD59C3C|nr:hypothetical protein [Microbacterium sp. KSW-48]MDZ8173002.1 hypothetical protein [Microbacterium sp. KSW-48]
MLYAAVGSAIAYSVFTVGSKGGCLGVVSETGFLDENGVATDVNPTCVSLTLGPSPLVYVAFGAVVFVAIGRVLTRADSESVAFRILDRASFVIVIAAAAAIVVSQVWFGLIPLDGIGGTGTYLWPFPFASGDVQTGSMTGP